MANTLNLPERTLAQLADSTNSINTLGAVGSVRKSWDEVLTVRVTDHATDEGGTSDPNKMAIFKSRAHGQPWVKEASSLVHITEVGEEDPEEDPPSTSVTTLYPNFDYSTFS